MSIYFIIKEKENIGSGGGKKCEGNFTARIADVVRRIPIDSSEPRDFIYPSRSSVQVFDKEERLVARKDRFDKYARMYPAQKSRESSIFIAKLYSRREQNCNFAISLPPCLGALDGATLLKEVRWR